MQQILDCTFMRLLYCVSCSHCVGEGQFCTSYALVERPIDTAVCLCLGSHHAQKYCFLSATTVPSVHGQDALHARKVLGLDVDNLHYVAPTNGHKKLTCSTQTQLNSGSHIGELVEGAANVKMLCWEAPFEKLLGEIRRAEERPMLAMQMINGFGAALKYFCVPLAGLVTFAAAAGMGQACSATSIFGCCSEPLVPNLWATRIQGQLGYSAI